MTSLGEPEFQFVAREMKARCGAVLSREMGALIEQRLTPIARRENFGTVSELISAARTRNDARLSTAITEALLQSETRFFRDRAGFERLRSAVLPDLHQRKGAALRILCAGVSTGQEAYSIAMLTEELRQEGQILAADIVAIDVSERLLDKARAGLYTQFEVQRGLPIRKLISHFEKAGDLWRISDRLRASVRFEAHNLLTSLSDLGRFDVILCCNVINTFDAQTRMITLERLNDALETGGALLLGASEALPDGASGFAERAGVFVKTNTARAAA
jgi:chemotaxis protein methyltransferase CheR